MESNKENRCNKTCKNFAYCLSKKKNNIIISYKK